MKKPTNKKAKPPAEERTESQIYADNLIEEMRREKLSVNIMMHSRLLFDLIPIRTVMVIPIELSL